jgi:hypothetical protein
VPKVGDSRNIGSAFCGVNNDWVRLHEIAFNFWLTPVKLFGPIHNKGRKNEEAKRFLAD